MKEFIVSILTAFMSLLFPNALVYWILSIFIKSAKPKIITAIIFSLIISYVLLFEMDDINKFGAIIGIVITGFIGYKIFTGKGKDGSKES